MNAPTRDDPLAEGAEALVPAQASNVELIAAAQGVDHHAPLRTSARLQAVHDRVRAITPRFTSDRYWADDMAALQAAVLDGEMSGGWPPLSGS